MKKALLLILAIILCFSLVACGNNETVNDNNDLNNPPVEDQNNENESVNDDMPEEDEDLDLLEDIYLNLQMRAALMGNSTAIYEIVNLSFPVRKESLEKKG